MPDFEQLVKNREAARSRGDFGLVREITIYLERHGYVESAIPVSTERAVPSRPRGRPRKAV